MKPRILTYPSLQRLASASVLQMLCYVIQVVVSLSKGLACCNLCPPNTSFWTTDGSVNRRKVGVFVESQFYFTSLLLKVLASRITSHMKLRHPDSPGWAPWGSSVSLRCKFCAFATFNAPQWATHLNECKHLLDKMHKNQLEGKKTSEDRDGGTRRSPTGPHGRRSRERFSRSPRRSWSPRREACPWGRGPRRQRSRSNSRSRAAGAWRSGMARRSFSPGTRGDYSSSPEAVCRICGEKFEGDLALHLAICHQDLSFRYIA